MLWLNVASNVLSRILCSEALLSIYLYNVKFVQLNNFCGFNMFDSSNKGVGLAGFPAHDGEGLGWGRGLPPRHPDGPEACERERRAAGSL